MIKQKKQALPKIRLGNWGFARMMNWQTRELCFTSLRDEATSTPAKWSSLGFTADNNSDNSEALVQGLMAWLLRSACSKHQIQVVGAKLRGSGYLGM